VFRRLFLRTNPVRNLKTRNPLRLECLEEREVPAVTLGTISQPNIANDKPIFIPVNVISTPAGNVTTSVTSDNANVTASVVSGGQSIRFDVSGTDSGGVPFSGSITVRLFTDAAPNAAQRLVDLVNSGYYTGKNFPRIINNFMIQGGGTTTSDNSPLSSFPDEFNADYTFASSGVLAMANSGDDTNNSQFFITDTKTLLAQRHQDLNFNYSIVGVLTDGFDIYQKIITTPVQDNGSGETSRPTNTVTITGAAVFTDTKNAVIKLTPNSSFGTGTANIVVTADDGTGPTVQNFTVAGVNDNVNSPPFITTPIPDQTATAGTPVTFTVNVTDIDGDATTLAVKDSAFNSTTIPNATVSINQTTKQVTITPNAGFTGTITFKVGVRASSAADTAANYDTQTVNLTVTAAPVTPGTGPFTVRGSVAGTNATVTVLNADGSVRFTKTVFDPGFTGGVNAVQGDINDDGVNDVIVTPGEGGGGVIHVLDSVTGSIFRTITFFANDFRGGVMLEAGDTRSLGYDQVIVGAGNTGGPRVMVLDLKTNRVLSDFFAGNATTRGGVGGIDLAEVFNSKGQNIIVGSGVNLPPNIQVFNGSTVQRIGTIPAAAAGLDNSGIRVRAGEMNTTTNVRPIFAAPLLSPAGTPETQFDPAGFMDPANPSG
jgi:cyclophilin family peptidyl-prolyl cis-trans isomerase